MFRLHKLKSPKSGDRIEFRFSSFKATKVPKGWDKLYVYMFSVKNGKTIAKSNKVPVHDGSCQWSDTFSESIWVSRDNNSSKEADDCLLKIIVAMGSLRSGILGEATVNLATYMSSNAAIPLSIPLKKCNHGTVLQVTMQCTQGKKLREETSETNSHLKALNENGYNVAVKSNGSDCSYVQGVESSVEDFDSTFSSGEVEPRDTCFSGSLSNCSYNSAEGSTGRATFSPSMHSPAGRQDSPGSQKSVSYHVYSDNNSSQSNHSSKVTDSSNNHLQAAQDKSGEVRAEAKMWEMNARKLVDDLDMLRTAFSDQSKKLADLEMDLSAVYIERDSLKKEVEQLKSSLEDPTVRQKALEDSTSQGECIPEIENTLKDELKFHIESNANLSLQLKRSQEANIELVSVLQELEETIEQQKVEIENLSSLTSKFSDLEKSFQLSMEGNRSLTHQLEQLEESKKTLLVKMQELEDALEDKMHGNDRAKSPPKENTLSDIGMEYERKLSTKEEEILSLKAKLVEFLQESCNAETVFRNEGDADLMREIKVLKEKVQELEMDCNELTNENLDLLFKLKEAKKGASEDLDSNKPKNQSFSSFESEVSNNVFRVFHLEDMLQGGKANTFPNGDHILTQEFEPLKLALEVEITEMANLEANLSSKEKEIGFLPKQQSELNAKVYQLEQGKTQLEEHMEVIIKERDVNSKCLYQLQNDFANLSKNMDSHVSANENLARRSIELEQGKLELELYISRIEQEKEQLSIHISLLEARLRDLTNEQESHLSELEDFRSLAARLQEEILEMQSVMDSSKEDLKQREEYCSLMEARLRESEQRFVDYTERVELLEKEFDLMLEEVVSKEKHLDSELDGLLDENRKQMAQGQSLLNQMHMEKMVEVQNLKQEIESLILKLSATYDEKERIASNALLEISAMRSDKAKMESAFEEIQSKMTLSRTEINMMQTEYEQNLKDLTTELAESKMKKEMMMAEHDKFLKLVEDYKSRELKFKSTISALELKLTDAEYDRQQLMDESGNLKIQLQQTYQFENEIVALKDDLNSVNSEKERLEVSLRLTSELCDDLKTEKTLLGVKILTMEKAASELEDCKRTRASLEERIMQLESGLKARETRFVEDTELSHIKRITMQHQQTIQLLEQEKSEFHTKPQALEEQLKLIKEQKRNQVSKLNRKGLPAQEAMKASKNLMVKNTNQHRGNRKRPSLKNDREIMKDQRDLHSSNRNQSEVETEHGLLDETVYDVEVDPVSKVQLLETEVEKPNEANNLVEIQLNRSPEDRNNQANGRIISLAEGDLVTKERFEHTKSMLEKELTDLQERYFHMSLKYAEAEAGREELVMKLKEAKNKKGWFS
ncbi:unnamed protein product [Lupinus luteus]|uniref:C2 NT-type domain-containing protein n=1 Tax=Lupinus luteus TaxID=3873 RepID=A0AAV1X5B1_LUPLU